MTNEGSVRSCRLGLEFVELAMDEEAEFGIAVPEEVLKRVATVGDFYDAVLPLLRETGAAELRKRPDLEEYLWSRLTTLASEPYGVASEKITRATRFVEDLGFG